MLSFTEGKSCCRNSRERLSAVTCRKPRDVFLPCSRRSRQGQSRAGDRAWGRRGPRCAGEPRAGGCPSFSRAWPPQRWSPTPRCPCAQSQSRGSDLHPTNNRQCQITLCKQKRSSKYHKFRHNVRSQCKCPPMAHIVLPHHLNFNKHQADFTSQNIISTRARMSRTAALGPHLWSCPTG